MLMDDTKITVDPPKGTLWFFNLNIPPGLTFNSLEEKLLWMAENKKLVIMRNVALPNL